MKKILFIDKSYRKNNSDFNKYNKELIESNLFKVLSSNKYQTSIVYATDSNVDTALPTKHQLESHAKILAKQIIAYDPDIIICLGNVVKQNLQNNVFSGFNFQSHKPIKVWGIDCYALPHPNECLEGVTPINFYYDQCLTNLKKEGLI